MNKNKRAFEAEKIAEFIKTKQQGEMVTFKELQEFTHYDLKNELELYHFKGNIVPRVKDKLIEYGYVLKAIKNQGYYILKSNQIQSFTYRTYIKKPMKQFAKAERILKNTIVNDLNSDELTKHKLTYDLNKQLMNTNKEIIELKRFKDLDL